MTWIFFFLFPADESLRSEKSLVSNFFCQTDRPKTQRLFFLPIIHDNKKQKVLTLKRLKQINDYLEYRHLTFFRSADELTI